MFDVPVEHMREYLEKAGATGNEPEQPRDVDAGDLAVEGVIDVWTAFAVCRDSTTAKLPSCSSAIVLTRRTSDRSKGLQA
ncbi:hypothetical protein VSR68_38930 [Paraburkholderia phymatum]